MINNRAIEYTNYDQRHQLQLITC